MGLIRGFAWLLSLCNLASFVQPKPMRSFIAAQVTQSQVLSNCGVKIEIRECYHNYWVLLTREYFLKLQAKSSVYLFGILQFFLQWVYGYFSSSICNRSSLRVALLLYAAFLRCSSCSFRSLISKTPIFSAMLDTKQNTMLREAGESNWYRKSKVHRDVLD